MPWKKKILFQLVSLFLLVCLFTPFIIKIGHGLYEHKETVCLAKGQLHIHEVEFDCDFHKFQITSLFYFDFEKHLLNPPVILGEKIVDQYTFLSKYQKLHFVLRGPPMI